MRARTKTARRQRTAPGKRRPDSGELLQIAARLQAKIQSLDIRDLEMQVRQAHTEGDEDVGILRATQILRDAGRYDQDQAFYLIFWSAERLASRRQEADQELNRISQLLDTIEEREGLEEDEDFRLDDLGTSADWQALAAKWSRRVTEIQAAVLREHGEDDMADLLLTDPDAFRHRADVGREQVFGPGFDRLIDPDEVGEDQGDP